MENTPIPKTTEPHYVVARLLELPQQGTSGQLLGGFRTTPSAVKFMFQHRELWPYVALPALINFAVFIVVTGLLLWNSDWFMLPQPNPDGALYFLLIVLWWFFRVLLIPLLIAVGYFLTMILAGIVASPFNDTLSERAEELMMGRTVPSEEGFKAMLVGAFQGVLTAAATGIPRAFLVLVLGLVPGVGPLLAAIVGAYFIAVGYTDYAFGRRKYSVRQKLATVWKYRRVALGFGISANLLLLVPLINFLCMPIAVVGGTAVAIALDDLERANQSK